MLRDHCVPVWEQGKAGRGEGDIRHGGPSQRACRPKSHQVPHRPGEQQHFSNWWLCLTQPPAVTLRLQLISWSGKWDYPCGSAVFSEKPESISLIPGEFCIKLAMVWQPPELAPVWHLANLLNTPARETLHHVREQVNCCWNPARTFRFVSFIKIRWKQMNLFLPCVFSMPRRIIIMLWTGTMCLIGI